MSIVLFQRKRGALSRAASLAEESNEKRCHPRLGTRSHIRLPYLFRRQESLAPKILALALALGLDLKGTSRLLHAAHLPQLYAKKSWDSVLIFALTHKKSVMETNLLLDKLGESPLLG
ncbi:hypothetical protein [Selenomonas sputigena]|uniref:hypothetical protein n=1 Tax=Selenomonas sputigena TaxID=69823 RepID=UPI002234BC55|nr:hypothetical protein [Selenomonas sputigena]UZE45699.1 hypothetical protein OL236_01840 [Selenomonas sputigena]